MRATLGPKGAFRGLGLGGFHPVPGTWLVLEDLALSQRGIFNKTHPSPLHKIADKPRKSYHKARFVAWLGQFPQEAQDIWLPHDDLAKPEDWQQPGLLQLTMAHAELISKYRCQEGPAPAASQDPADARSRQPEAMVLRLPQLNRIHEASSRDNGAIASGQQASQAAASSEPRIPTQRTLTRQISAHWGPFLPSHSAQPA